MSTPLEPPAPSPDPTQAPAGPDFPVYSAPPGLPGFAQWLRTAAPPAPPQPAPIPTVVAANGKYMVGSARGLKFSSPTYD